MGPCSPRCFAVCSVLIPAALVARPPFGCFGLSSDGCRICDWGPLKRHLSLHHLCLKTGSQEGMGDSRFLPSPSTTTGEVPSLAALGPLALANLKMLCRAGGPQVQCHSWLHRNLKPAFDPESLSETKDHRGLQLPPSLHLFPAEWRRRK